MRCFTSQSHLSLYDSAVCKVFQQVFFLLPACGYATRKLKFCQQLPTLMSLRELYDFLSSAEHKGIRFEESWMFQFPLTSIQWTKTVTNILQNICIYFLLLNTKEDILKIVNSQTVLVPTDFHIIFCPYNESHGNRQSLVSNILENLILCFCMYFL